MLQRRHGSEWNPQLRNWLWITQRQHWRIQPRRMDHHFLAIPTGTLRQKNLMLRFHQYPSRHVRKYSTHYFSRQQEPLAHPALKQLI